MIALVLFTSYRIPAQIRESDAGAPQRPGIAMPGQFNAGVERRHVLPSSAPTAGLLYFSPY
jgi:hypothetical protein